MTLEKLTFTPMSKDLKTSFDSFEVLFNPNSYSITKTVTWNQTGAPAAAGNAPAGAGGKTTQIYLDAPTLNFGGGGSRQLTLNLFFDVTETPDADVRDEISDIVALTRKDRDQKCPLPCEISWGGSGDNYDFPFVGVVTSLTQNFVLFDPDGTPLRANVTVILTEYPDPEKNQRETDPELTTRVVKAGDTISSIAGEFYGDPGLWRTIADANGLDDPRRLQPGMRLTIPKTE